MVAAADVGWGPLRADEQDEVATLLTATERHDRTGPRVLHGWRHQLAPAADVAASTLAGRTADGALVALGWVSTRPHDDPPRRFFLTGAVRPDLRRHGLGRRLLDWQLSRAAEWQRETGGGPIVIVASTGPGADVRSLLARAGFEPARVFVELGRPMPRAAGETPVGVSERTAVVPFDLERADEIRQVLNASFAEHWGARPLADGPWRAALADSAFRPDWSWLALDGDRVVAFVLNSAAPHPDGPVGWTDQLGVLPTYRGRGLARRLMAASLTSFEQAGLGRAGLGLDTGNAFGAPALYARLGYRQAFEVHLFTRSEPALPAGVDQ